jgi:hypothetical protein
MLTWKRDDEGWVANGYRIRLVRPYTWELLDSTAADAVVITERTPLAVTRTLSQCKREAELLAAATRIGELRRRYWGVLVMSIAGFMFVPTLAPPGDLIAVLVLLLLTCKAVGFIAGTYMARSHISVNDFFYQ